MLLSLSLCVTFDDQKQPPFSWSDLFEVSIFSLPEAT
ncbi:hypothetical protein SLEP1_g8878 [Rubroshorea leprosula]|uniref:Uncharacterized protein n=1 Tax=Rubroshorea leprosula TaxID=152421 RepID=A0AAV5IEA1_9ROSI|nr:hypothetical protein SLEP1_g8878 [Rubroshorea leprosula]